MLACASLLYYYEVLLCISQCSDSRSAQQDCNHNTLWGHDEYYYAYMHAHAPFTPFEDTIQYSVAAGAYKTFLPAHRIMGKHGVGGPR